MGLRRKKKELRERRIMQAGRELFIEKGFNSTTMEEIAARSDLGVGTLYNYFKNKNALLVAIFDNAHVEAVENIESITSNPPPDPVDGVLSVVYSYDSWSEFGKPLLRDLMAVSFREMDGMGRDFLQMDMEVMGQLGVLLAEYQRRGAVSGDIKIQEAVMLIYSAFFMQIMMYISMDDMTLDMLRDVSRRQFDLMFHGLAAGNVS